MMAQLKFRIISLSVLFITFITFPIINNNLNLIIDSESSENRAMAAKPVFDINLLDPFPENYEKYYNDDFSLRSKAIKYFTYYNLRAYNKSPFPDRVVIGNNGWLFQAGNELDSYLGTNRLTIEQLEAYKLDLEFQKKFLEERGCKFYFMISPTKATIHSENMPYSYYRYNHQSLGEQLLEYLAKNSEINVISVYEPFRNLKKSNQLYFKHDNHWNRKGAFYAATIATERIQKDFPKVKPLAISDFVVKEVARDEGDIVRMLGNPDFYEDSNYEFTPKSGLKSTEIESHQYVMREKLDAPTLQTRNTKDSTKPKVMVISDSFADLFFPFFSESFGKSVSVFDQWRYKLYTDIVEQEKPDVYLLMIYEPFVMFTPDNHSRFNK